jgi:hypothetical protein
MKMKLFFLFFLVVLLWSNNHALRCINNIGETIFEASKLTEIKKFIDGLDADEEYEVCSIVYGVQYPQQTFVVTFGEGLGISATNVNTDVFYHVTLTMALNGNIIDPAEGQKSFSFTCNNQNACERQFWRDHIDWFIQEESTGLEAAFRSILMIENKEKGNIDPLTTNRKVLGCFKYPKM